jgi:hypothetical protein
MMLPGGMTPVVQVAAMIRGTPPRSAIGLLTAMPADRLRHVIAALAPRDIARLLPAMRPEFRDTVAASLSEEQLAELAELISPEQLSALVDRLPTGRLPSVAAALPDHLVIAVLAELPEERQAALREAVGPQRLGAALAVAYERAVAAALQRANAEVLVPDGVPRGTVVAHTLGRYVVVTAGYGDDGRRAVRDAEHVAYGVRASAALSVTNHEPAEDVVRYCREARLQGRPVDAIAWVDARYDGLLKRTLATLIQGA